MSTTTGTAPNSTFRTVALVTSSVAAALSVLCAAAMIQHGDQVRDSRG